MRIATELKCVSIREMCDRMEGIDELMELIEFYGMEPFGDGIDAQRQALIAFNIERANAKYPNRVKLKNCTIGGIKNGNSSGRKTMGRAKS